MKASFYSSNRRRLSDALPDGSVAILYSGSGDAPIKTADELYPFYCDRNFLYLTGIDAHDAELVVSKSGGNVTERLYILPPDLMKERWTGRRIKPDEASEISGITDVRTDDFHSDLAALAANAGTLFFDRDFIAKKGAKCDAALLSDAYSKKRGPSLSDLAPILAGLRTIKTEEEIAAHRRAEEHTRAGILAMMESVKDGMYEYQLKAEFDRAVAYRGSSPSFPPIISSGANNFCIHYYAYSGRVSAGELVLCDVGAFDDYHGTDVSRAFPVDRRFTPLQRKIYDCAYETSEHMFSMLRPGLEMSFPDAEAHRFCAGLLCERGLLDRPENVGKYMWHGGAHHVGLDTHDVVAHNLKLAPGMIFCVDIGIYIEELGIGFRLEDNCLITEAGCENLSASIPRSADEIEAVMNERHG